MERAVLRPNQNLHKISYTTDVVVVERFQNRGIGKALMHELMSKTPDARFYLTSTLGNEEFYKKTRL
jgi:predicted N-acetyltransferase YhbS